MWQICGLQLCSESWSSLKNSIIVDTATEVRVDSSSSLADAESTIQPSRLFRQLSLRPNSTAVNILLHPAITVCNISPFPRRVGSAFCRSVVHHSYYCTLLGRHWSVNGIKPPRQATDTDTNHTIFNISYSYYLPRKTSNVRVMCAWDAHA